MQSNPIVTNTRNINTQARTPAHFPLLSSPLLSPTSNPFSSTSHFISQPHRRSAQPQTHTQHTDLPRPRPRPLPETCTPTESAHRRARKLRRLRLTRQPPRSRRCTCSSCRRGWRIAHETLAFFEFARGSSSRQGGGGRLRSVGLSGSRLSLRRRRRRTSL